MTSDPVVVCAGVSLSRDTALCWYFSCFWSACLLGHLKLHTPHRPDFRVARKKVYCWSSPTGVWKTHQRQTQMNVPLSDDTLLVIKTLWNHCVTQTQHLSEKQHPHREAWWWQYHNVGMMSFTGPGELVRTKGTMDGTKSPNTGKVLRSSRQLRPGWRPTVNTLLKQL